MSKTGELFWTLREGQPAKPGPRAVARIVDQVDGLALAVGGHVVAGHPIGRGVHRDPPVSYRWVQQHRLTAMHAETEMAHHPEGQQQQPDPVEQRRASQLWATTAATPTPSKGMRSRAATV